MATFCQECYNVNEVSVKIMLVRSLNSFVLMSPGYKVTIESAIMYVTKSFWLTPKRWKTLLKKLHEKLFSGQLPCYPSA